MSTTTARAPRLAPAARRAQIADAARELALADGLSALTLRAVAARAGVAPALVAHYVPTMDDLVATTFSGIVRAELDDLRTLTAHGSPVARLARLLHALLDGTRDDVTLVWVEAYALGRGSERLAEAVRTQMDLWHGALRELLAAGLATGEFRIADATDASWQLLGMIDGLNAQALVRWGGAADRSDLMLRAAEGMLGLARGALDRADTGRADTPDPTPTPADPRETP